MAHVGFEEITEKDVAAVLEIYTYYVLHSTATFHTHPLSMDGMRKLLFFSDPRYRAFTVKSAGAVLGYVILARYGTREAFERTAEVTIYLKPDSVGKGIGGRALAFIETVARQNRMHALVATICGENAASIRLFEKNGYRECARYREIGWKFGRYLDLLAYQKILV